MSALPCYARIKVSDVNAAKEQAEQALRELEQTYQVFARTNDVKFKQAVDCLERVLQSLREQTHEDERLSFLEQKELLEFKVTVSQDIIKIWIDRGHQLTDWQARYPYRPQKLARIRPYRGVGHARLSAEAYWVSAVLLLIPVFITGIALACSVNPAFVLFALCGAFLLPLAGLALAQLGCLGINLIATLANGVISAINARTEATETFNKASVLHNKKALIATEVKHFQEALPDYKPARPTCFASFANFFSSKKEESTAVMAEVYTDDKKGASLPVAMPVSS